MIQTPGASLLLYPETVPVAPIAIYESLRSGGWYIGATVYNRCCKTNI